ncbi:hypothetical protein FISHEDRAFT_70278 [Fistulina hepatica ATCC 64428]|uniref:Prolyl 4-hydroxylase alpha subunit Fe(2+) 2OG dioxygenase domain-containing protein n=1 Tax=Fistulina hepatica ATCC 64428 TaxID=1128425 RepID=A0A0D7AJV2_9AGAR|nr:hypothetical protein FISHEDRAFT_70278 [Fistulina hepatica ATCC 64428]
MSFDVYRSGLIRVVETELMKNSTVSLDPHIVPELYKLNVYEAGGFFKAHVDTPRASNMFGTLVIVFPTMHQGGQLVLRHNDKEWSYDSAAAHEVLPVTAGYRLALTYNLCLENRLPGLHIDRSLFDVENKIQAAVAQLMVNIATTLPKGGYLGFDLSFKYPVELGVDVRPFKDQLKGRDALIMRVCQKLNLKADVLGFYWDNEFAPAWVGVSPRALDPTHVYYDDDKDDEDKDSYRYCLGALGYLADLGYCSMLRMRGVSKKAKWGRLVEDKLPCKDLVWVTDASSQGTNLDTGYVRHGNEAVPDFMYGDLAIFVKVPPSSS